MKPLSKLTAQIGNVLAEIKQRNKMIEMANKLSNPTFIDIIEDLEKDDKTLCNMLLLWYCQKYLDNPIDMEELMDNIKSFSKPKKTYEYRESSGCGSCSISSC